MSIEKRVKKIVAEQFEFIEIPSHEIKESARFKEDFGADSLDIVEFEMELESEFNIMITDEEANNLPTVGSVIEFIKEKKERVAE